MSESATKKRVLEKICETCGRSFARNEHLVRHRRIHTSERPFSCPLCQIGFPRGDVREKHMKRFHTAEGLDDHTTKKARSAQQQRSKLACDQCRRRKLKCDEQRPCQACRSKELSCTVSSLSKGPGRPHNREACSLVGGVPEGNMLDKAEVPGTVTMWQPGNAGSLTTERATNWTITGSSGLDLLGDLDTSFSGTPVISRVQQQTHPNAHAIPLPEFDAALPTCTGLAFGEAGTSGGNWEDLDLMNGIWELPPLGVETWLHDLDNPPPVYGAWTRNGTTSNDSQMDHAIGIMVEHFQRRSRASSPTTQEARRLWYSAPPLLQVYDKEVMNVLLNVARRHLATTFAIYATFEATSEISHELCLAMASVGGLFSAVDSSTAVAKALYNDARRMHLEKTDREPRPSSLKAALNSVKTYILLAIYGICSGDKRSYEFVEAFHLSTMQAVRNCWQIAKTELDPAASRELSLVSEALDIIESYHVLLLQRPPYFLPTSHQCKWQASSMIDLASMITPVGHLHERAGKLREIANLGVYTWRLSPRGQERSPAWQLWRSEFVELGLERWREATATSSTSPELSPMLLYHLAHIHLQVNLGILQRFAHKFVRMPETSDEKKIFEMLRQCTCGQSFKAALWHAKAMLRFIKENIKVPRRRHQEVPDGPNLLEPPHLPYCIYFATLMIWYGEYASTGCHAISRDACIESGLQLLGMLKVRVAKVLANALCELFPDEHRDET